MVEDWETFGLDEKCPSQVGNVYNRLVPFQVWLICVDGLLGVDVLVLNHDRPGGSSRQGG